MQKNIFAFTSRSPMPEYLSINREASGALTVSVRSPAPSPSQFGSVAMMTLRNRSDVVALVNALHTSLASEGGHSSPLASA